MHKLHVFLLIEVAPSSGEFENAAGTGTQPECQTGRARACAVGASQESCSAAPSIKTGPGPSGSLRTARAKLPDRLGATLGYGWQSIMDL